MAWGDFAKVGKLLSSLGQMTDTTGAWSLATKKRAGGKGTSKGGGKDGSKGNGKGSARLCPWAGCKAAENQQATWGGLPNCHCCKRSFAQTPPVEHLVEREYKALLSKRGGTEKGSTGKGAAGKGAAGKGIKGGKGGNAEASATELEEQLAQLRLKRQAELKEAKETRRQRQERQ